MVVQIEITPMEGNFVVSIKLPVQLLFDPPILFLGVCLTDIPG